MSKRERIEALEARVAALEARPYHGVLCVDCGYRLDEPDPSNSPGGLGDAPDNTPGGRGECVDQDESGLLCTMPAGHAGDHVATGGPEMILASWPNHPPVEVPCCDADCPGDVGGYYSCYLTEGHDGPHDNNDGVTWTDPEPDAEVIDAQIVCGVSHIIDGAMRYCDSGVGHDGEHVSEGRARRTWTDPAPVPQWRYPHCTHCCWDSEYHPAEHHSPCSGCPGATAEPEAVLW